MKLNELIDTLACLCRHRLVYEHATLTRGDEEIWVYIDTDYELDEYTACMYIPHENAKPVFFTQQKMKPVKKYGVHLNDVDWKVDDETQKCIKESLEFLTQEVNKCL